MKNVSNSVSTVNNCLLNLENDWSVSENDIALDLKILLKDCFRATMSEKNNGIYLNFDNGQKFVINISAAQ